MNKYFICINNDPGVKNLMEIIYQPFMSQPYYKAKNYAVVAEADSKDTAFENVRNIIEAFVTQNPDCDFSKFKEWRLSENR